MASWRYNLPISRRKQGLPHHHHQSQITSSLQCTNANLIARFSSVILFPGSGLFAPLYPGVSTSPVTVKPRSVIWLQYIGLLAKLDDSDITVVSRLYRADPCLAASAIAILARVTLLTRCRKKCHYARRRQPKRRFWKPQRDDNKQTGTMLSITVHSSFG